MVDVIVEKDGGKVKYDMMNEWNDMTIGTYIEIIELYEKLDDRQPDELDLIGIVNICSGVPLDDLYKMDVETFNKIGEHITFLQEEIPERKVECVTIDDEEYYVAKNFNNDMNMGMNASIKRIINNKGAGIKAYPDILCILFRKKLDGEIEEFDVKHMNRADKFKNAKLVDTHYLIPFFLNGSDS